MLSTLMMWGITEVESKNLGEGEYGEKYYKWVVFAGAIKKIRVPEKPEKQKSLLSREKSTTSGYLERHGMSSSSCPFLSHSRRLY